MIIIPFKTGQKSTEMEAEIREISRSSQTSGKFPRLPGTESREDTPQRRTADKSALARLQTAFDMVIAGSTLMTTTPPGLGKHSTHRRRGRPDQSSEQMTHFGNGQGQRGKFLGRLRGGSRASAT